MSLNYIYTPDVPQPKQKINSTQQPINFNFQDISQLIAVNHVPFNTANTFGQHNAIDYFIQSSDPSTGSNEIALYSKAVSTSDQAELFYRYPNNGSVVQLTGTNGSTTSSQTTQTGSGGGVVYDSMLGGWQGWQYLANGILMKFGVMQTYVPTTSSGTATFSFSTASGIPAFSQTPFHMEFNMNYPGSNTAVNPPYGEIYITPLSATQFSVNFIGQPYGTTSSYFGFVVFWMAIGV